MSHLEEVTVTVSCDRPFSSDVTWQSARHLEWPDCNFSKLWADDSSQKAFIRLKLNGTITANVSPFCLKCKYNKSSSFSLLLQGMFQNDNESSKKFGLKNVDSSLLFFALLLTFMWLMRLICVGSSETGPISCLLAKKCIFCFSTRVQTKTKR